MRFEQGSKEIASHVHLHSRAAIRMGALRSSAEMLCQYELLLQQRYASRPACKHRRDLFRQPPHFATRSSFREG